jgi:FkbM family methyltransferase
VLELGQTFESESLMYRQPLKLVIRDAVSGTLGKIPSHYFEPLRRNHCTASKRSIARRASSLLLKLVRYRKLDSSIDSFVTLDEPQIRIQNTDCVLVRSLYWFGLSGYEDREYEIWRYFCSNAKKGILEIGANVGFYTVMGSKMAPKVPYTAVEPHPITFSILQRNIALNQIENVILREVGVVGHKTAETMSLMVPVGNQGDAAPMGTFLKYGGERQLAAYDAYTVPLVEAETLFIGIDLIKMDVEGYEFEILSAVEPYLATHRPAIFVEVLKKSEKLRQFIGDFCKEQHYSIHVFKKGSLLQVPIQDVIENTFGDKYKTRDLILVPPGYPLPQTVEA